MITIHAFAHPRLFHAEPKNLAGFGHKHLLFVSLGSLGTGGDDDGSDSTLPNLLGRPWYENVQV